MNRLQAIRPFGQRIWLDNLSRDLLRSGELSRWIDEDGIAGVTSNPAIFHKAIRDDVRYVSALQELKALPDLDAEQRYEQLVIPDIQAACDLLEPQYRASQGDDGYVSLEVSPALAHDAEGTVDAALGRADRALYDAKRAGRNRVVVESRVGAAPLQRVG